MTILRERIADLSIWWKAMAITSFATGMLVAYMGPDDAGVPCAIGMLLSFVFTFKAASAHYYRHHEDAQVNTTLVLVALAICIIGWTFATLWPLPQLLQVLLTGFSAFAASLTLKNALVSVYKTSPPHTWQDD